MKEAARGKVPQIVSLPRTRRLSWVPTALEFTHQVVLACWMGGILVLGFLVVPGLYSTVKDAREAAWAGLDLTLQLNFVSAGAGTFLLLLVLLMYLLALRSQRSTLIQIGLLLGMTGAAVASHVWIGPQLAEILRENPDFATMGPEALARFDALGRWSWFLLLLQLAAGAAALVPGVRRWYRYVSPGAAGDEDLLAAADAD